MQKIFGKDENRIADLTNPRICCALPVQLAEICCEFYKVMNTEHFPLDLDHIDHNKVKDLL